MLSGSESILQQDVLTGGDSQVVLVGGELLVQVVVHTFSIRLLNQYAYEYLPCGDDEIR
jgi:hypothetical protein